MKVRYKNFYLRILLSLCFLKHIVNIPYKLLYFRHERYFAILSLMTHSLSWAACDPFNKLKALLYLPVLLSMMKLPDSIVKKILIHRRTAGEWIHRWTLAGVDTRLRKRALCHKLDAEWNLRARSAVWLAPPKLEVDLTHWRPRLFTFLSYFLHTNNP